VTSPQGTAAPAARGRDEVPSKTLATWIAVIGGSVGLHHFYLHGWRSRLGWLYPIPGRRGAHAQSRRR
jgi:hypothetical protein